MTPQKIYDMEDNKEEDDYEMEQEPVKNSFLSLLQREIPDLKVSNCQVHKEDISLTQNDEAIQEEEQSKDEAGDGFYDVLGLSKRSPPSNSPSKN